MKIAFFEIEGWEEEMIRKQFPESEVFVSKDKVTSLCLPNTRDFEVLSVFIDSRIDKNVLDCFPNVKCIATRSTGYDHIDVAECKQRGIAVLFVPGYGDNTVAEFTFGLLLNLTRNIYQGIDQIKETGSFAIKDLRGTDLAGKVFGVIGTGRIGKRVVKIAQGFDMRVIAYDPHPDDALVQSGIAYMPLEDLLKSADIVSVHCPYNAGTHHLLNKNNLSQVKRGAYLVNTARGGIIETEAVVNALEGGALAGYAADVLEEEGEMKDELDLLAFGHPQEEQLKTVLRNHMLIKMPNVLITPHNAFNSQEALGRILSTTIDNIRTYLAGKPANVAQ